MHPAPSDDVVRDTYAHFGLAIFRAQVLEHGIVNAMVILRFRQKDRLSRSDIDAFMDQRFENTLGRLIALLKADVSVPAHLKRQLNEALGLRNLLAHRYFRERAEQFMSEAGALSMQHELQAAQEVFRAADRALTSLVQPIADANGLTAERIEVEYQSMLAEIRRGA
jgi:predicted lipoprotein